MGYRLKTAMVSFVLSFVVLFPIGVFLAINLIESFESEVHPAGQFRFLIPKEFDLNFMFVNSNLVDGRNLVDAIVVVKISAHNNSISLASVPANTKTIVENKLSSLQEFFEYGGIVFLKNILENLLQIKIDRFVQASDEAIQGAINCLGGLKLSNDEATRFDYLDLPVVGQKRVIGGERFCNILKQDPIKAFVLLKFDFFKTNNLSKFFAYFANMVSSNISAYDFELRKRGFEEMVVKGCAKVLLPAVEFEKFKGRDRLTSQSRQNCEEAFKKSR